VGGGRREKEGKDGEICLHILLPEPGGNKEKGREIPKYLGEEGNPLKMK